MITSKESLRFYLEADRMMNRGTFSFGIKDFFKDIISPDYVMRYLKYLRKAEYFSGRGGVRQYYYKMKLHHLGSRLGFSIAQNVFGYGLVIPHYGTIVVGDGNEIGNYAVLHTSICITAGKKKIGDGFYCSTGAKVLGNIELGNYVTVGANAVVNHDVGGHQLLVGIPAACKRENEKEWFFGEEWTRRVQACEERKVKLLGRSSHVQRS